MNRFRTILRSYRKNPINVIRRLLRERRRLRKRLPAELRRDFYRKVAGNGLFRRHKGETAYILCTGPSIKDLAVESLVGKCLISVSHFTQHPACARLRPRYHFIAANHPPFGADHYDRYVHALEKWDWPFTCFFGYSPFEHSILDYMAAKGVPKFDHTFYRTDLNHFRAAESFLLPRAWDFSKSIPPSNTVLVQALQFAVYAGFKRIVLLGCDHDYAHHFGESSIPHFYEASQGHDDSAHLQGTSTERWFKILGFRWEAFRRMKEYGQTRGVEILNATPGSKLDVFPMVNLRDVV